MKRALLATTVLGLLAAGAPRAIAADPPLPVLVTSIGPKAMRVRLAAGNVQPCDSGSNKVLRDAMLEPGQTLELATPESCVCVEHTLSGNRTEWADSRVVCRPRMCDLSKTVCRPADDQAIRLTLSSSE